MSITCPRCHTSFSLFPDQIGTNGRKVKCSNCQHIWYQKPEFVTEAPSNANNQEQSIPATNKPVQPDEIKNSVSHKADNLVYAHKGTNLPVLLPINIPQPSNNVSIILINLIFLLLYILFHEKLNILALPKFHNNKLMIDNIQADHTTDNNQLKVSYRITNHDNEDIIIPLTRVRLLDKQDMPVKTYILDQKNIKLLPKQYIDINTTLKLAPFSSTSLDIMLGNSLDFILQ